MILRFSHLAFCGLCLFLLASCSQEPSVVQYKVPKRMVKVEETPQSNSGPTDSSVSWDVPDGWVEAGGSSMRMASFSFATEHGNADISLVRLGGFAGGTVANVNRWRGQIGLSEESEQNIMDTISDRETVSGWKYSFADLRNVESGQCIQVGMFQDGSFVLFAKMSVPLAGLGECASAFDSFCKSLRTE